MLTDDVVFLPPNAPAIAGKKAVESLYRTFFAQFNIEHKATTEEIQVNGDWAFAWGGETLTLIPVAGGPQAQLQGKGMSILKRQPDGSWRFSRGINNMTPQAASATPPKK
jgi:ketosteroid isomerase-like protein